MNKKRRASLSEAIQLLTKASALVDRASDGEQDALDNLPENLQYSEKAETMEGAVELLNDAVEKIDGAKDLIESAMR